MNKKSRHTRPSGSNALAEFFTLTGMNPEHTLVLDPYPREKIMASSSQLVNTP